MEMMKGDDCILSHILHSGEPREELPSSFFIVPPTPQLPTLSSIFPNIYLP